MSFNFFHSHIYKTAQKAVTKALDTFMTLDKYLKIKEFHGRELLNAKFKNRPDERLFIITPGHKNWVTIYTSMPEDELMQLTQFISAKEKTKAFWFMAFEEDIFLYNLFKNGETIAEYNSCPNYFENNITNREIIESKEDSSLLAKEFPQAKAHQNAIKTMLTEGWIISRDDFERDTRYLNPMTLMNDFGEALGISRCYLNLKYRDVLNDEDSLKSIPEHDKIIAILYRKRSYLWIWLIVLLFIFSGKLIQLFALYF